MTSYFAAFIDVGFLRAEGARALQLNVGKVRPNASGVVSWLKSLEADGVVEDDQLLRAYWYDGAFDSSRPEHLGQKQFFDAIAFTPGIQLRLGHLVERPARLKNPVRRALEATARGLGVEPEALLAEFDRHWTFHPERSQKGVDSLIVLDLVRLAQRGAYGTAVLLAGDRDLAEAVRTAQDSGRRIVVATPSRSSLARELAQLADAIVELDQDALQTMLSMRA